MPACTYVQTCYSLPCSLAESMTVSWNYKCIWRIRPTIRSLVSTLDTSAWPFNPFMLNGFSNLYELDEFISNFKVDRWYFSFYSNCSRTPCKQTLATLIRRWVLRHLIWVCTICICPIKKDASLIWDKRCLSAYVIIIKMPRAGQHVYQPMSCRSRFPLFFENTENQDQLASHEVIWSGSTLFPTLIVNAILQINWKKIGKENSTKNTPHDMG